MSVAPLASKSKAIDQQLSAVDKDGVPSDSFCAEVSKELDQVQQSLLDAALKMFPEQDASRSSENEQQEKIDELEREIQKYTHASLHGMNVRS